MPELPEVETVANQLKPEICGRTIKQMIVHDPKLQHLDKRKVLSRKIKDVFRYGKQIIIELESNKSKTNYISVHLRMTGRLLVKEFNPENAKHLRLEFILDKGKFYFQDIRRFGVVEFIDNLDVVKPKGIDPLSSELTGKRFYSMLEGVKQNIKTWLLRQDRLVGLGNIYVSEILYASKIDPQKRAGDITLAEAKLIYSSMKKILKKSIKNCGTTFSDFQNAKGETGEYQKHLKVYKREGESCEICGTEIKRIVQQQRSTFYCPKCQK